MMDDPLSKTTCQVTSMSFDEHLRDRLMQLSPSERTTLFARLSERLVVFTARRWGAFAHQHQREPEGGDWTTWLMLGGRGAGKTRAGAEWVRALAADGNARIALVGETEHDVREVMIEGVSGILAVHPLHERPEWVSSR